ncbi:MAG TPA: glycosyltransferase family 4 protein [Solirubrobacteraceae bacterium]|jgi:glycosyltransferase involved in cell wall biosynthesis|nr:glycosyltransferase family 4 protein [Solirubrobacteraceae bacterium]
MKVLYAIDSLHGGGAETSLLDMVPALRARDVELSLVTLLPDDDALTARVQELGVPIRRLAGYSWPKRFAELRRELHRSRPDLLHTSLARSDMVGRAAAVGVDVPVVTTLVNSFYGPEHRANSAYGPLVVDGAQLVDMLAARRTTVFHAISYAVADVMTRRLRLRADRVEVVYRGRDEARLGRRTMERREAVRTALGISTDTPLVLIVGRLDLQKAVDVALRATGILQQTLADVQTIVVGRNGNAARDVHELAASMQNVRMLGHRDDVPDLMCAADCLCFPSRWEGLGGTVIEAMALELPIVASDIGPIREALGDVGWPLATVDDVHAVADGLSSLLAGGRTVAERVANGRRRYENVFTMTSVAEGMVELYSRAIAEAQR